MFDLFLVKESLLNLCANPLRSALSLVGVIFGVGSVVAMLSIGLGAEAQMTRLLDALGARNIHVQSTNITVDDARKIVTDTYGLADKDVILVQEFFPSRPLATLTQWKITETSQQITDIKGGAWGVSQSFFSTLSAIVKEGRAFIESEEIGGSPVVLLGENLAKSWFGVHQALGKKIRLNNAWFEIIGVLSTSSSTKQMTDEQNSTLAGMTIYDNAIILPRISGIRRLGEKNFFNKIEKIVVELSPEQDPIQSANILRKGLDQLHRKASVFSVQAAEEIIEQKRKASEMFSIFLLMIASVSLLVGGIGIANVMLASMVERIREVGLRRALGAKKIHIIHQFLLESLVICWVGGIIGWLLGWAGAALAGHFTGWPIGVNISIPFISIGIASIVGLLAGLYPALAASKISPIVALQGR